jgi:hypothetical protein
MQSVALARAASLNCAVTAKACVALQGALLLHSVAKRRTIQ